METKEFNRMMYEPNQPGLVIWSEDYIETVNEPTTWQPTPDEIRECCGVWVHEKWPDDRHHTTPDRLIEHYESMHEFRRLHRVNKWIKLEPIPEQCIPKPAVPEERYLVRYPLLAGIF